MRISSTVTSLIIATIYCASAVAVLAGVVTYVDQQRAELLQQMEVVAADEAQERQYTRVQQALEKTAEQRARVESFTLAEDATISLLAELETLGRNYGVALETQNLTIGTGDFGPELQQLRLAWQVAGSVTAVQQFLDQVETLPYVSRMNRLSIREADETSETGGTDAAVQAAGELSIMLQTYAEQD